MLGEVRVEAVRLGNLPPLLVGRLFMFFCASVSGPVQSEERGRLGERPNYKGSRKPRPPGRVQQQDGSQLLTLIVSVSWVKEVA